MFLMSSRGQTHKDKFGTVLGALSWAGVDAITC